MHAITVQRQNPVIVTLVLVLSFVHTYALHMFTLECYLYRVVRTSVYCPLNLILLI